MTEEEAMKTWVVEVATAGKAWCEVEAETEEEAIEKALTEGEWEQEEWDVNTQSYRGGFVEAREI